MAAAKKRPSAITKLSETPNEGKRNWLIYAPSGVGKTVLAGTAPKALFLTVEAAGTESAKALGSQADEWVCDSWAELQNAYTWLKEGGYSEYEWVILDSISEMQELCWKDQLEGANSSNSSRSLFQPAIQDYPVVDNKIKRLVDSFNRMPINVLYTAQQMALDTEDSDGDDIIMVLPLVGRSKGGAPLSNLICGKVTLIGLLTIKQDDEDEVRRLWVHGGERWIAKDRHDTFGKYIEDPNIVSMSAAVDKRLLKPGVAGSPKKATTTRKKAD